MSAIQPSIVARLKPELVAERKSFVRDHRDETTLRRWQPLEYKDQILDLLPSEYVSIGDTAQIGDTFAEVVTTHAEFSKYSELCVRRSIRVQFYHKIEA